MNILANWGYLKMFGKKTIFQNIVRVCHEAQMLHDILGPLVQVILCKLNLIRNIDSISCDASTHLWSPVLWVQQIERSLRKQNKFKPIKMRIDQQFRKQM